MTWSKPAFVEIILGMEATAYVNTDAEQVVSGQWPVVREEKPAAVSWTADD